MMKVFITKDIEAFVLEQSATIPKPRFMFPDGIYIGNANNYEEHMENNSNAVGTWDFYATQDGIYFDTQTGKLTNNLFFSCPDGPINRISDNSWLLIPPIEGILTLPQPIRFEVHLHRDLYIDNIANAMISLADIGLTPEDRIFRLRIAPDFDLLFINDLLSGWVLFNFCSYLTKWWGNIQQMPEDNQLNGFLHRYFELNTDSNTDLLWDQDAALLGEWGRLRRSIDLTTGSIYQREIVYAEVEKKISDHT